jgi:hypothetical protein
MCEKYGLTKSLCLWIEKGYRFQVAGCRFQVEGSPLIDLGRGLVCFALPQMIVALLGAVYAIAGHVEARALPLFHHQAKALDGTWEFEYVLFH